MEESAPERKWSCACSKHPLCIDSDIRKNLFAVCMIWSMSGFCNYLIMFYSKYFKGSVYINYAIGGLSQCFAFFYVNKLSTKMSLHRMLKYLMIMIIGLTLLTICLDETEVVPDHSFPIFIVIMVFLIKVHVIGIQNYSYFVNQQLFPVLVRGRAYGVTNFVSRPITGIAPILTEYTSKPLYFVCGFSFVSVFTIPLLKILESEMRESDKVDQTKNTSQV